jgi:hypothetical protein
VKLRRNVPSVEGARTPLNSRLGVVVLERVGSAQVRSGGQQRPRRRQSMRLVNVTTGQLGSGQRRTRLRRSTRTRSCPNGVEAHDEWQDSGRRCCPTPL